MDLPLHGLAPPHHPRHGRGGGGAGLRGDLRQLLAVLAGPRPLAGHHLAPVQDPHLRHPPRHHHHPPQRRLQNNARYLQMLRLQTTEEVISSPDQTSSRPSPSAPDDVHT